MARRKEIGEESWVKILMSSVEKLMTVSVGVDWEFLNGVSTVHTNFKRIMLKFLLLLFSYQIVYIIFYGL